MLTRNLCCKDKIVGSVESYLKQFIPPVVIDVLNDLKYRGKYGFSGNYENWNDALNNSIGYDCPDILARVKEATIKLKAGEAVYERDSVLFDEVMHSWPLLAGLLRVASHNDGNLGVLDFGGSLGTSYYQNKNFLSTLQKIRWCVVEQPSFVDTGKKSFQDDVLTFYHDIRECDKNENINVVLLSGVLQYLENPHAMLDQIINLGIQNIIIDRTPFMINTNRDLLTVQAAYPSSYPHWFFELSSFLKHFVDNNYYIVNEFNGFDKARIKNSKYLGFILSKSS
jgi:putative methyltransferase (TIGR04325 family)